MIPSISGRRQGAPARAASSAVNSSRPSGPSSSTSAEPERRTPSASRRIRPADAGSSARQVASSRTGRSWRLCARKTTRSSVEVSAQCRSSSTSSTGAAAARSVSSASVSSNTRSCEPPSAPARQGSPADERLGERLVRQLRADQIDRAADEDLEPGARGTSRELGREPGLADARLSGDQDGRTVARPRRLERALKLPELACASDEHLARREPPFRQVSRSKPWLEGRS